MSADPALDTPIERRIGRSPNPLPYAGAPFHGAVIGGGPGDMASQGPAFGVLAGYRLDGEPRIEPDGWLGQLTAGAPAVRVSDGLAATAHVVLELNRRGRGRLVAEVATLAAELAKLDTTYLITLLDHAVDDEGRPVIFTAAIGHSLARDAAERGPLPIAAVLEAAAAGAAALQALHGAGLRHRAVGTAALRRGADGRIRLSCPAPPMLAELLAESPNGTGHEPPEVLGGADWTEQAEVYALASALWTLLDGRPPVAGSQEQRLARIHLGPPPNLRRAEVPEAVAAALTTALSHDPAERPADTVELLAALECPGVSSVAPVFRQDTVSPSGRQAVEGRPLGAGYWLQARIGSGSSGTVYRVLRRRDSAVLAAKLLRSDLAEDHETVFRLLAERATLTRLAHPNLVKVHDLVAEGSDLAIIMDYVDGADLRQLLTSRRLTAAEALHLLGQIGAALAAVHAAGVVHRDLKPENILITGGGAQPTALLTDFGLARVVDRPTMTRQSQVLGTPAYLAPEQLTGRQLTSACDIYAFGVTAYELLAGHRPFRADSPAALMRAHLEELPQRPVAISDRAWALLRTCLAKDPAQRPAAPQLVAAMASLASADVVTTGALTPTASITPLGSGSEATERLSLAPATTALSVPLALPPDPCGGRDDDGSREPQQTLAGTRPPAPAPAEPATARRRRWPLLTAVLAVALLGLVVGIQLPDWLARVQQPPDQPGQTSGQDIPPFYPVMITARVDAEGRVVLTWSPELERLPGFQSYSVWRDGRPVAQVPARTTRYADPQPGAGACYKVFALGVTLPAPAAPPVPQCP